MNRRRLLAVAGVVVLAFAIVWLQGDTSVDTGLDRLEGAVTLAVSGGVAAVQNAFFRKLMNQSAVLFWLIWLWSGLSFALTYLAILFVLHAPLASWFFWPVVGLGLGFV